MGLLKPEDFIIYGCEIVTVVIMLEGGNLYKIREGIPFAPLCIDPYLFSLVKIALIAFINHTLLSTKRPLPASS